MRFEQRPKDGKSGNDMAGLHAGCVQREEEGEEGRMSQRPGPVVLARRLRAPTCVASTPKLLESFVDVGQS